MSEIKKRKVSRNSHQIHQKVSSYTTTYLHSPFSISLSSNDKKTNHQKSIHTIIKDNSNKDKFGIMYINDLIESKNCHAVAIFKDYMIADFIDEFLRREYEMKESIERIPKYANYYKNYLTFFYKPIFRTIFFDSIIQNYGEAKAEIYYNIHYCKKKKKKKSIERLKTIFSDTIKKDIENDPVLTQGNNDDIQESISLSIDQSRMSITKNSVEASLISILNGMNEQKQRNKKPYVKPLNDNLILSSNRMNKTLIRKN